MDDAWCGVCRFVVRGAIDRCHRFPPQASEPRFPKVDPNEWCGEFKPRGDTAPTDPGRRGPSFSHGRRPVVEVAPPRRVVEKA